MSFADLWKEGARPTVSFELYPQRDPRKAGRLEKRIGELAKLKPDFFSVTFGAGGTTREGSLTLVESLRKKHHMRVLPYFACIGLGPGEIDQTLDRFSRLGVESVLCVRGDEPVQVESFEKHPDSFDHADQLIAYVNRQYDFIIGTAGYPEVHREAASLDEDIRYLKGKVEAGARYIITQYFFDNQCFYRFRERCRREGIDVPILAGVLPVYSVPVLRNLSRLCGATITYDLQEGLDSIDISDRGEVHHFGVGFAIQQCADLIQNRVDGIHFYTLNRVKSVRDILSGLRAAGLLGTPC